MARVVPLSQPESVQWRMAKFAMLLILLQTVRAAAAWLLWRVFTPGENIEFSYSLSVCAFLIAGIPAFVALRPTVAQLGLDWSGTNHRERIIYGVAGALLLSLVVSTWLFEPATLIANVYSALFIPAFEELVFRGYGWSRIQSRPSDPPMPTWITWMSITLLFGLWHVGYADSLVRVLGRHTSTPLVGVVLYLKVCIGIIVGALTGLLRWRTGRVFGPFVLHAIWNVFGR